jgi:hypothetical protein
VGIVDLDRCLSLLQHSTKLYLVNHGALAYGSLIAAATLHLIYVLIGKSFSINLGCANSAISVD